MPQPSSSSPGAEIHLQAVLDHLAHGEALKASGRTDSVTVGWAITALFYAALHAVRAYLKACKTIDVTSHEDFNSYLRQFPELRATNSDYDLLKQQSQSARYYCNPNFTWADFDELKKKADRVNAKWRPLAERCLQPMPPTSGSVRLKS